MSKRLILAPSAFLRKPCTPIDFEASYITPDYINNLITDMTNVMINNNGCGLAAPQVGICKQIIIIQHPETKSITAVINPKITVLDNTPQIMAEGCLSYPSKRKTISRPTTISITGYNSDGTQFEHIAKDFEARIYCHEVDHLKGRCSLA